MDINEQEMIEIQTQLRLVNNAYFKFNQQRAIVQNLEEEFQNYFNGIVEQKGGDSEKQWQLDLENKQIVEAQDPPVGVNNGQQPQQSQPSQQPRQPQLSQAPQAPKSEEGQVGVKENLSMGVETKV